MNIITLTKENLAHEHICCAMSGNQADSKKAWLYDRLDDGLVFKKADVRGKCFIEYIPAEKAWAPVSADGYIYINCMWVSGQLKGKGYSAQLLTECIDDAKNAGKSGLVTLSSKKKLPFLADPSYLTHAGFLPADEAEPYYVLYYLPFDANAPKPQFLPQAKHPSVREEGFVLFYSHQCPYTAKYVPLVGEIAQKHGVAFKAVLFETAEQARSSPAPFTSYSIFYNGSFLTNEILSEKKFEALINEVK